MSGSRKKQRNRAKKRPRPAGAPEPTPAADDLTLVERFAAQGLPVVRTRPVATRRSPHPDGPASSESGSAAPPAPPLTHTEPSTAAPGASTVAPRGCASELDPDLIGLTATYEYESGQARRGPYTLTVRFAGRRRAVDASADPRDTFDKVELVEGLLPDSGRITVTTKVVGVNPGQWDVTAIAGTGVDGVTSALPQRTMTTHTRMAALLHGPGEIRWAWPLLVLLGVLVAAALQAVLLARAGGDWRTGLAVSAVAVVVGYLSAKAWYLALHRQGLRAFVRAGTCIQGFLLGMFAGAATALVLAGEPVGPFLDATAPGLFLAMAIGRPGCLLGGCCVGRPTRSRWAVWSSDRRVGARRIPVQLLEAAMALVLGVAALGLIMAVTLPVPGALFVGAVALYTGARQLLFPLRHEPRRTPTGRIGTLVAAATIAVAAILISVLST